MYKEVDVILLQHATYMKVDLMKKLHNYGYCLIYSTWLFRDVIRRFFHDSTSLLSLAIKASLKLQKMARRWRTKQAKIGYRGSYREEPEHPIFRKQLLT